MQGCSVCLHKVTIFSFADESFLAVSNESQINEWMNGVSKIYMRNFGFSLGTYICLTFPETRLFLDEDTSKLINADRSDDKNVDFSALREASYSALGALTILPSNYCSILTLYLSLIPFNPTEQPEK